MQGFKVVECEGSADDCVIEVAKKRNAVIATFDRKMRKRARELGIKLVTVRKGAYVMDDLH